VKASGKGPNHPLAWRMVIIACLAQNTAVGMMVGSFGTLVESVEAKMGVDRELSSLGLPLAAIGMALLSPVVGSLSARLSLRWIMILGAIMNASGYGVLAGAKTITANLLAYGLLVGPGLALLGTVAPSTLVSRWFVVHRGRGLGIVNTPLFTMVTPLGVIILLRHGGLSLAYSTMASLFLALLVPLWFVVDYPPSAGDPTGEDLGAETAHNPGFSTAELLRSGRFWVLILAVASIGTGAAIMYTHLVPMTIGWGLDATHAALLIGVMGGAGILGSIVFGWIADKVGGGWATAINCMAQAVLWTILLLQPTYPLLLLLIAMIGVGLGAIAATIGVALSELFGPASFGRGYGLSGLITLPFIACAAPLAGVVFGRTGSYAGVLILQVGIFVAGAILALTMLRRSPRLRVASAAHGELLSPER
jgi:predicted MFS family arabinose efflux permease